MNSILRPRPASIVAAAVALALGHAALAQSVLGEVTVTARKRAESLQDVPFAVSARSGEALRNAGATNVEEISRTIAGFTVQNLGPGQSQVAIRGISAGKTDRDLPGVKEQVGVYLDESPISLSLFTPDLDLYDLNRVEVLRGPQGTLFGSGSIAGTLRYISNQPDPSGSYGDIEVGGSSIDGGDVGGNVRGMFNMPMSDTAALRVVGYYSDIPGFIDAVQPGGTVNEDVNGGTRYGVRVAMRFEPNENLAITPRVIYQDVDIDGFNRTDFWNILGNQYTTTEPRVALGDRQQYTQLQEKFEDDFLLADLTIEVGFGEYTLTSISSYTDRDILVIRDASQLTGSVTYDLGAARPSTSAEIRTDSPLYDATQVKVFSQELRVASDYDGAFQWVGGAFYSDIDRHYGQSLPTAGYDAIIRQILTPAVGACAGNPACFDSVSLGSPPDTPFFSDIPYDIRQFALFAELNFNLGERASLTVGGRYYDFSEDRVLYFGGLFADSDLTPDEPNNGPQSLSSSGFLPRVLFSYDVSENLQLNAQVARGFRLGGVNDPLNTGLCTAANLITYGGYPTFEDEELTNYELGAKIGFADGRAQFNVSAFYADIDDFGVPVVAGSCSSRIIVSVPEAHSQGVEVELAAQPTDNFEFGFSATMVDSEIDTTVSPAIPGFVKGNRMASVPEFQMAANATYKWPLTDRLEGYMSAVYQHVGDRYTQLDDQRAGFDTFTPRAFGSPTTTGAVGGPPLTSITFDPLLPEYDLINLRFGVRADQWEAALFINNVSDESANLGLDQERGRVARVGFLTNQPRTIGLSYRRSFGN
ncbi:MAG: TonB-dependent receptor [Steroidobacteraceae bacterium]